LAALGFVVAQGLQLLAPDTGELVHALAVLGMPLGLGVLARLHQAFRPAEQRVGIVRALATQPKLLLLDEPAAGMNPSEKEELMILIEFIRKRFGMAILLVEHDMKVVMGICERIAVLEYGIKIAEGTPKEIQSHPKVIEAYLGASGD
jgi:ABC-type branched-subunit amino acid transport system ATPase component